jgi:hypothetical protein
MIHDDVAKWYVEKHMCSSYSVLEPVMGSRPNQQPLAKMELERASSDEENEQGDTGDDMEVEVIAFPFNNGIDP